MRTENEVTLTETMRINEKSIDKGQDTQFTRHTHTHTNEMDKN